MPSSMEPFPYGTDPRVPMNSMGQQQRGSFPPQPQGAPRGMDRNHAQMPPQFEMGAPHPSPYAMMGNPGAPPPPPPPHAMMMNRGPPPRRFAGHQPLPPPHHGGVPAVYGDFRAAEIRASAEMQAEMLARASLSPSGRSMHPPGLPQGLPPPQQQGPFLPGSIPAASVPLKESVAQNVPKPQSSSVRRTAEEQQAYELEKSRRKLASVPPAPNGSPSKQETLQDAASALLTMGSVVKTNGDDSPTEQDAEEGDGEKRKPKAFPTRLALPDDEEKLNSMHCFLRSELLELFLVEEEQANQPPQPASSEENSNTLESLEAELIHSPPPNSAPNRVGIRCVHCARARKIYGQECEAPMAVFYPKSLAELYRLVTSWQRVHLRKCRNLPRGVRETYQALRETDKTRGKTHYWVTSAKKIGLRDSKNPGGGVVFAPDEEK